MNQYIVISEISTDLFSVANRISAHTPQEAAEKFGYASRKGVVWVFSTEGVTPWKVEGRMVPAEVEK